MSWNDGYERKKFNARIKKEIAEYKFNKVSEYQNTIFSLCGLQESIYKILYKLQSEECLGM